MTGDIRVYADRSDRGKLRFSGPQRAWFLHQILTQAFEDIELGEARDAALLTPHGRMVGYLEIVATTDDLRAHFEPELGSVLLEAIERFVFATRVEIADVTEDHGLALLVAPDWDEIAARVAPGSIAQRTLSLGAPAGYMWIRPGELDGVSGALEAEGLRRASEDELEALRVERGMARWGRDMDSKTLPPEVGLDDVAVRYDKGCYTGQEAMAKIRFRGKVNRKLRRLEAGVALGVGDEVTLDGVAVGRVTSASDGHALAVLKHTVEPGMMVTVGDSPAAVASL